MIAKLTLRLMLCSFGLIIFTAACLFTPLEPLPTLMATPDGGVIHTQAALTLAVQITQVDVEATQRALQPSITPSPSPTSAPPTPTPTRTPTVTLFPSITPILATATPLRPCNSARFVDDISIPDGTTLSPGAGFTKTWEFENTGSCTWTQNYAITFVEGDRMSAPDEVRLSEEVAPGEHLIISVNLIAPTNSGEYKGLWYFKDDDGELFGLGNSGESHFWVDIEVEDIEVGDGFSFVSNLCTALWENDAGTLPCPGSSSSDDGFVIRLSNPELENRKENEAAIWMHPENVRDGWIQGTYPPINIKDGDKFLADIGCLANSDKCNVIFRLSYKTNDGDEEGLGKWQEDFDGGITRIELDLSKLDDESVRFIFKVEANGVSRDDNAFWLVPQIRRKS
jgi:hypothetical protein